jgi:uncharacterized membrane protein
MLLPIPIIIFVVFLIFSVNKAKKGVDVTKHVTIRLSALFVNIGLIFFIVYLTEGNRGLLGSFYFSAYFIGVWLLYLIVEAICLFVMKQNRLGKVNLLMLALVVFILAFSVFVFSSVVH